MKNVPATVEAPVMVTLDDVKRYIAPNATDKELYFFMSVCNRLQLDPIKREVHFVKYGSEPGQTVIGYTVYLKRAEDLQKLDGWKVWIENSGKPDEKAVISIKRKDWSDAFMWEVMRREFDKKQAAWNRMPTFMLKKVAIAQGFRLAFPKEMGGLPYIPEEINGKASEELPHEEMPENGHADPDPPKSPSAKGGFKEFLLLMAELKAQVGDEKYYSILGAAGVEHANEIKDRETQKRVYRELQEALADAVTDEAFPGATQQETT